MGEAPSCPPCPHSRRCGSPRTSMTSPAPESSTANASKRSRQWELRWNVYLFVKTRPLGPAYTVTPLIILLERRWVVVFRQALTPDQPGVRARHHWPAQV